MLEANIYIYIFLFLCICLCVHVPFVTVACCVYWEIQGEYNHQTARGGKITLFSQKVADKTPHINHTPARGFSGCDSIFNTARLVTPKVTRGFSIGFNLNYDFGTFGNIVTATWESPLESKVSCLKDKTGINPNL